MSDQNTDSSSGQLTKEDILDALKKNGVTDLDSLAEKAAEQSQAGEAGAVAASWIVHPGYVINN